MSATDIAGLKILAFCDYFSSSSSGGAERVTAEVFSRLIDQGAEITMVTAIPGARAHSTEVAGVPTRVLRAHSLARPFGIQAAWASGYRRAAEELLVPRPDVIHVSGLHFHSSVAGARTARRHEIPLVVTAHVGSISGLPPLMRSVTAGYERVVAGRMLRQAHRTIAVSRAVADHIARLGASRITVVPNGVDHAVFFPDPDRPVSPLEAVFVGRLIGNKSPDLALQAFASLQHPTARLTFVGEGPMRATLERKAASLGAAVRFLGHRSDVADVLRSAHVLVRPSQTEGQSLAILEAMASGTAVIASDIAANREIVEPDRTGLLHRAGDDVDLADGLGRLLTDTDLRNRLAEAAHEFSQRFSWDRCAHETGQVLIEAAAS